ncbi:hypothetical protein GJI78_12180 [Lactococcus lactis subsp. cremoris]|uniref:Prophage pi3 protein 31 n=1 Tax=Lactococcus lactis subsp. lactis (strain IL1403) TaxID=272623 RepID=Q9CFR1_LACLA|nr:hypothetical protein [Lactococcus lactis]NP_076669.1 Orf35 [Lactococcus phage bIL286]MRM77193.1 hypothetical protein [Lactococcus cremoris]AAK05502.1 prophage pi3 protein 31 [Lactococcus lactis subsp. lactis Il1403]AAK08322.1 Orf35 [Lactococcus phage bIL286]AYV53125.1 hypothetical protein EFV54_07480 [Lactococcus lactis]MRL48338.1 hypothetical protein [Lactococcus lactis subsp. lactis]
MITAIAQIMTSISIIILLVLIVFTNKRLAQLEVKIERCRDLYNGIDLVPLRVKINYLEGSIKALYKYKVLFKRGWWSREGELQEEYFFTKKQADKFIDSNNLKEVVIIRLEDNETEIVK